jgi:hypothetical protein
MLVVEAFPAMDSTLLYWLIAHAISSIAWGFATSSGSIHLSFAHPPLLLPIDADLDPDDLLFVSSLALSLIFFFFPQS